MRRVTSCLLLLAASLAMACRPAATEAPSATSETTGGSGPRLVLILVVDQLRADYFDRFGHLFEGGFGRLLRDGVRFTDAHHRHAVTHTAPGHATLATGTYPRHHGVVSNWWVEEGDRHMTAAVDDDVHDESPLRLLMPTLGDWFRRKAPLAKVYGISRKDRAAIFLSGPTANGAYWYDSENGNMETSSYWTDEVPGWVRAFNDRRLPDSYFGRIWEPMPVPAETLAELGLQPVDLGPLQPGFPHVYGRPLLAPDEGFYRSLSGGPWLDQMLLEFARQTVEAAELGRDGSPDVLAISLSAFDSVGHDWGPDSREALDHLLLLDRWLGEFFDWLDGEIGLDDVVVGLSADHGVVPIPEVRAKQGLPGKRAGHEEIHCLQNVDRRLSERLGVERVLAPGGFLEPDLEASTGHGRAALEEMVAREAETCPSVTRVWTRTEVERGPVGDDPFQQLWANSYYPGRSPDFMIQYDEFFMPQTSTPATHMSPYDYDTAVPMLFMAPGLEARLDDRPAWTVDFAPTLAGLVGIQIPLELDGRNLFADPD